MDALWKDEIIVKNDDLSTFRLAAVDSISLAKVFKSTICFTHLNGWNRGELNLTSFP